MVSPATLEQELDAVRKVGYATAPNEGMIGINALAVPIFDSAGALIASVAIVDSIQFVAKEPSKQQLREIQAAARQISESLGYSTPRTQ